MSTCELQKENVPLGYKYANLKDVRKLIYRMYSRYTNWKYVCWFLKGVLTHKMRSFLKYRCINPWLFRCRYIDVLISGNLIYIIILGYELSYFQLELWKLGARLCICFTSVFVLAMRIYLLHNISSFFYSFFSPQLLDSFKFTHTESIFLRP